MKPLEEVLQTMPKPDIQVPEFRNQLRRDLLNSMDRSANRLLPFLAVAGACAALVFGLLLVVFVAKPDIPAGIHTALAGKPEVVIQEPETFPAELFDNPSWSGDGYFQQTGFTNPIPVEHDAAYARDWYRERFPNQGNPRLQPGNQRLVSLREFVSEDGRRVRVITEIPNQKQERKQDPYEGSF